MNSISNNIKQYRKINNMTQRQLAEKTGVSHQTVSNWESGRSMPDIDTLIMLSEKLDIEVDFLLYGKKSEENKLNKELKTGFVLLAVIMLFRIILGIYSYCREAKSPTVQLLFETNKFYVRINRVYGIFFLPWQYILPVIVICLVFKCKGALKEQKENKLHLFAKVLLVAMVISWYMTRIICFGFTYNGNTIFKYLPYFLQNVLSRINTFYFQYPWSMSVAALVFELTRPFRTEKIILPAYSPGRSNSIARNIKNLREQAGFTQQQLADKMYITRQTLSNWENGKVMPDVSKLIQLSDCMGTQLNDLLYSDFLPDISLRISFAVTFFFSAVMTLLFLIYRLWWAVLMGDHNRWVGYIFNTYKNMVETIVVPLLWFAFPVLTVQFLKLKGRIANSQGYKYRKRIIIAIAVFIVLTIYAYIPALVKQEIKEAIRTIYPLIWLNYPSFDWLVLLPPKLAGAFVYIAKRQTWIYAILGIVAEMSKPYNSGRSEKR